MQGIQASENRLNFGEHDCIREIGDSTLENHDFNEYKLIVEKEELQEGIRPRKIATKCFWGDIEKKVYCLSSSRR